MHSTVFFRFSFGLSANNINRTKWILTQRSDNPIVYTKLSCFLPWIAAQYGMTLGRNFSPFQECLVGTGDINEYSNLENGPQGSRCRNVPPYTTFKHVGYPSSEEVKLGFIEKTL